MNTRARSVIGAVVLAAICAACSGGGGPSAHSRSAFVNAQAAALCAVRGHKFANEQAQEAAYRSAGQVNIASADLRLLKRELDSSAALRAAITDRVAKTCP